MIENNCLTLPGLTDEYGEPIKIIAHDYYSSSLKGLVYITAINPRDNLPEIKRLEKNGYILVDNGDILGGKIYACHIQKLIEESREVSKKLYLTPSILRKVCLKLFEVIYLYTNLLMFFRIFIDPIFSESDARLFPTHGGSFVTNVSAKYRISMIFSLALGIYGLSLCCHDQGFYRRLLSIATISCTAFSILDPLKELASQIAISIVCALIALAELFMTFTKTTFTYAVQAYPDELRRVLQKLHFNEQMQKPSTVDVPLWIGSNVAFFVNSYASRDFFEKNNSGLREKLTFIGLGLGGLYWVYDKCSRKNSLLRHRDNRWMAIMNASLIISSGLIESYYSWTSPPIYEPLEANHFKYTDTFIWFVVVNSFLTLMMAFNLVPTENPYKKLCSCIPRRRGEPLLDQPISRGSNNDDL